MEVKRICIYPKDVQRITGKSERYGRMLLARIKTHYQKQEHQFVSIDEFCLYTGLKAEQVYPFIAG
jgi:predicted site-specific integrase-resolvase